MSIQLNGVAPDWVATGDGAYAIPAGYKCIGFYVTGGGTVNFDSGTNGLTPTFPDNALISANVLAFNAGGSATGVYAILAK